MKNHITNKSPVFTGVWGYLTNIYAASLLETTNYGLAEIATIVGYEDPLYFSRLFRKIKGVSPRGYRKLVQEGKQEHDQQEET